MERGRVTTTNIEDIFARKKEIQEKLAKERKRSEMIKGSLAQADELTSSMVAILNQFDERLHKLEDTILPLHRKTKDLQRLQDNIDKTITCLDHMIGFHHVAHEVEFVLRQVSSGQVDRYLSSMDRLDEATRFFSENNPDSPELNTVSNLFANGKERLEKEFHKQLSRQTKPLLPGKVLELIEKNETTEVEIGDYLPEKTVRDLSQIAQWLSGPGKSQSFTKSYAEIRSRNLISTLEGLREHVKGVSSSSNPKKLTVANTPKKSSGRRQSMFPRKASTLLRKESMQSLSNMGGLGKGGYASIPEEEVVDIESEPFVNVVSGCAKLLVAEYQVIQAIIPERSRKKVFDAMVIDPLGMIEQAGNKFVAFAKQCISNHDHPLIVNLFPAVQHLKETSGQYHDILKVCNESNRLKLPRLIGELESIGVKVLDDFTDCVKSDPEKESNMPKDGTVHELTSNTMLFMQQLSQNADIVGGMLAAQQHENQQSSEIMKKCLAQYISHVLGALKLNLDNKARVYVDSSLAAVFLLNNYHFILSSLDRHGLLVLIELTTPDVGKIYDAFIKQQKAAYLKCWAKVQANLTMTVDVQPGTKLKDKERQAVKDKFKSFNTDVDELVKVHQQWAMPNPEVKREIRNNVKQRIVLDYTRFRDKYRMVQFTKNIEKYLKYTPEEVEENIERLFDQCSS